MNLLSAQAGAGVGVCAVGALQPVGGGGAAGKTSGQPAVGSPLSAGCRSIARPGCHLRCSCAAVPPTSSTALMNGEGQRLAVVLLGGVRSRGPRAALVPQVLVLLAYPVQLALQLLDATPLSLQELGLALNYIVQLQEVLNRPVGALRAGLHGGGPSFGGVTSHSFGPRRGQDPPSPPALMSWGEGGTDEVSVKG